MAEENLFDEDKTPSDGEQTPGDVFLPDSVKDLIGPGKKYADVGKALEALGHAQSHIQTLETENKTYREREASGVDQELVYNTVQELLKKERETHGSAPLDGGSIESLLDRKLTEREEKKLAEQNAASVKQALVKKYGDKEKAQQMWDAKAKELEVGTGFLTDLAKKSPKGALKLFGLEDSFVPTPSASRGSLSTEAMKHVEQPVVRKSVMAGATTQDVYDLWMSLKPKE